MKRRLPVFWSCLGALLLPSGCGARSELHRNFGTLTMLCPEGMNDPRLTTMQIGQPTTLDASLFLEGDPNHVRWSVVARDCDGVASYPSYLLDDPKAMVAHLTPERPYPYRVRLEAGLGPWDVSSCEFEIPVKTTGLRIEACWTDDANVDVDLYVHTPHNQNPFLRWGEFSNDFGRLEQGLMPTEDSCGVLNCAATLRLGHPRVDFGYSDSPLDQCTAGPDAEGFVSQGLCPNPRMSVDNNNNTDNSEAGTYGVAERVQIDAPGEGDTFRLMLRNFNNLPTVPFVFIYCNGVRTEIAPPDEPIGFISKTGAWHSEPGVMWRPADITTHIDQLQNLSCDVTHLSHPADPTQPYVTIDDVKY